MRFAMRLLAACWTVGTTAGIARADKISDKEFFTCVGVMAAIFLLPLVLLMVVSIWLGNRKPKTSPPQQQNPSTPSETARDNP